MLTPQCLELPELREVEPEHASRCFRAEEIADRSLDPAPLERT
jgi:hypothetical protein